MLFLRWMLIYLRFSNKPIVCDPNSQSQGDITVIIPLKGWDHSLDLLLTNLCKQNYENTIEVIVVADAENLERLNQYSPQVTIIISKQLSDNWYDKNWRMYQGYKAASYDTVLFMDSDTSIDYDYLTRRTQSHQGHLSFSLPIYANASTPPEALLAAYTDYSNFSLYAGAFIWSQFNTSIGPSMMIRPVDDVAEQALYNNRKEASDDHSLGTYFGRAGKSVHLSKEPIVVNKHSASWKDVIEQIIRWLMLPRAIMHLIDRKTFIYSFSMLILSLFAPISLYILSLMLFFTDIHLILFVPLLLSILIESMGIMINEYTLLKRSHTLPLRHIIYVPLMLMLQPLLVIVSLFRKQFIWRGITVSFKSWISK
ncbi:MAG: glycosyltransferase [Fibrobacterales bacterium]